MDQHDELPIIIPRTWARPDPSIPYCAIEAIDHGSVHTVCRGRWSTSNNAEIHYDPPEDERCKACESGAIDVTDEVFGNTDDEITKTYGEVIAQALTEEAEQAYASIVMEVPAHVDGTGEIVLGVGDDLDKEWGGEG